MTAGASPVDCVVVGGGQAGLATAFWLSRAGVRFTVLDDAGRPGGAWARMWPSLRAFSPPSYSSLPGWPMPPWTGDTGFPPRQHVVDYLTAYEARYGIPVERPVRVQEVRDAGHDGLLEVVADRGIRLARTVVSATGTWSRPFRPALPGAPGFRGSQLHTADYRTPEGLPAGRVAVVGGGNSAAQLLAEVSEHRQTLWLTRRTPRLMPDDVDGRVLFHTATARRRALDEGREEPGVGALGDIVMVPSVRRARDRGVLRSEPMPDRLVPEGLAWAGGRREPAATVLWCTGFRPALSHLAPLRLRGADGRIATAGTRARADPRIHLMGYGDWTGPASATLIGVGRPAREAAHQIAEYLGGSRHSG